MTDDIVTRLREIPEKRNDVSFGIWSTAINPYFEQLQEAADEIERLREELEASKAAIRGWIEMLGEK